MIRSLAAHSLVLLFLIVLVSPVFVQAAPWDKPIVQCDGVALNSNQKACTVCDIALVAQNILNTGIYIAVFLSAILFVWTGGLLLTSGANPSQRTKAKSLFVNVLVGLLIILGAWIVIDVLMRTLLGGNLSMPWNRIC